MPCSARARSAWRHTPATWPSDGAPPSLAVLAPDVESIEDALAASPVVVEATYSTATRNHAEMEPHSAVAVWDVDGLTVYSGNRGAFIQAGELSGALDTESVRAVNPFVGGAFGGKARTSTPARPWSRPRERTREPAC